MTPTRLFSSFASSLAFATTLAGLVACGGSDAPAPATRDTGRTASSTATASSKPAASTSAAAPAASASSDPKSEPDYLKVVANHADPKKGKVEVAFSKWSVTKATFDPKNLEGGTAEIAVDVASLSTGIGDRDDHLKSHDYLDVGKFATATVKVDKVKKKGETSYSAEATISIHGIEKKWPLDFEVLSSTADSVRIRFAQPFNRRDFEVGGTGDANDKVKLDVELRGVLTLKKT